MDALITYGFPTPPRVWALVLPAAASRACEIASIRTTAAQFSTAIGGGLLDDAFYGRVGRWQYCIYLDEQRSERDLPLNERLSVLARELHWIESVPRLRPHGDAIVVGTTNRSNDPDVPAAVVQAASRSGLLSGGHPCRLCGGSGSGAGV